MFLYSEAKKLLCWWHVHTSLDKYLKLKVVNLMP